MSLPPGFLDELRSRVSIAQVVGRKVTWEQRKTNAGKGDFWAPCPFHQEKTASFHVDDRKGFYYCFGCHAKGDALSFLRESENMGFMEAVEVLAGEAGLTMPAPDPKAQAKAERGKTLAEVMEMAVQFYRLQLSTSAASEARAYLDRRGMAEETRARFEIGFAPGTRTALVSYLREKNIPLPDMVSAGLVIAPDDGGAPYDRFRNRIMFPIRDARGRCIAFGGRALSPEARAKYLNSPETPLFDKGRALYNIGPAREASGKSGRLVVAEGYMDVIALSAAGFGHAVAPLGTAVTEEQLRMLWRIADEPVIALDGDTAGLRAAYRVVDLALPLLEAGKELRFCLMPQGLDPDDLIRAEGPQAMQAALDKAVPMVALLWQRETEGKVFDSPERRAALDASLRTAMNRIADPVIRTHYREALREYRAELFRPARERRAEGAPRPQRGGAPGGRGRGFGAFRPPAMPAPSTLQSLLARPEGGETIAARIRESAILYGCLTHAAVAETVEPELERLGFLCPDLESLRLALLQVLPAAINEPGGEAGGDAGLSAHVAAVTGEDPLPRLTAIGQVRSNRHLGPGATTEAALQAVREEIERHRALTGIAAELREAEEDIEGLADEGLTWRLQQAGAARDESLRGGSGAQEGNAEDREALSAHLQKLIDQQIWLRRRK